MLMPRSACFVGGFSPYAFGVDTVYYMKDSYTLPDQVHEICEKSGSTRRKAKNDLRLAVPQNDQTVNN